MRLLLAILLAVAVLPAQAQTVDICDRTPQVRDAILEALEADDCAAVESDGLASVENLELQGKQLAALAGGDFAGLTGLKVLWLYDNQLTTLPAGVFDGLTSLQWLSLYGTSLTALQVGVFDGLTSLQVLDLGGNQLTDLPAGVFDGLTSLQDLALRESQLTTLPDGVFDGLNSLQGLFLERNQLTSLPDRVFDGLNSLRWLVLDGNQLTSLPGRVFDGLNSLRGLQLDDNYVKTLPDGVFDGLNSLQTLELRRMGLTTLPDGVFDDLTSLQRLMLLSNRLTTLPDGVFDGLISLQDLALNDNQLTALPDGVFDGLTSLRRLHLPANRLKTLPDGVFDALISLQFLDLRGNLLVGLTRNAPLFAQFSRAVNIWLDGGHHGTTTRLAAAVPLMLSATDSTREGFVRIVNESQESGSVRVFAFDDSGHAPDPIEIPLGRGQVVHFNSNDLENGNVDKGIEVGVGGPVQGDWTLDIETDWDFYSLRPRVDVRVLAFVRHGDGFLTAMHDVLPRNDEGRIVAQTFNPGGNMTQASRLRLVNIGVNDESVSIEGVDDQGNNAGPVGLTLPVGESRTLSAFDLENGAQGLTGAIGDGAGKWHLFITARRSVVGMSLLESTNGGQLTNISTAGVANE